MNACFMEVYLKNYKAQKSADGRSAAVSSFAEKLSSMAVMAKYVNATQGVTASDLAEIRAINEQNAAAGQANVAVPSLQSNAHAPLKPEEHQSSRANIVKMRFLSLSSF